MLLVLMTDPTYSSRHGWRFAMRVECAIFGGVLIPLCFLFDTMKPKTGVHQQGRVRSYAELLKDRVIVTMCISFISGSFGCKSITRAIHTLISSHRFHSLYIHRRVRHQRPWTNAFSSIVAHLASRHYVSRVTYCHGMAG